MAETKKLLPQTEEKIIDKIVDLAQYLGETTFYPYQIPFARRITQSIITNEGATLSALFARQCIAEGSFIMDRSGKVLCIEKHPDAWKTKEVTEIYEIKSLGGHVIYCTEEHPIGTDNGWIPAQCVTKNSKVVVLDQWDKFGDGVIAYKDKTFVMNNDLAELVGWLTAYIKDSEEVIITLGHERVLELITKYFPKSITTSKKTSLAVILTGEIKNFLKYVIKYDENGIPDGINYFTKEQIIRFFYPLFLVNGKTYKKEKSIKIALRGQNSKVLSFYKEHLNKLGIHGNYEIWVGHSLIFQCATNYVRFKELFEEYLPPRFFPPFYRHRVVQNKTFFGEDGEILAYSRVHSVKKIQMETPVWDINIPNKGWFLSSGVKLSNSGKTTVVAMVTAACMIILPSLAEKFPSSFGLFKDGLWAGCFGPIGEQAITMFDRIYDVLTTDNAKRLLIEELKMPIPARGGARGNLIKLQNKSFVRYQSASRRAKAESKTYHLILLDECLSGDTEILTPKGWVRIDSWEGQKIALLNNNFEVVYEFPQRYIQHDSVPLITAKCKHGLNYTTTPGHRIIYTPARNSSSIKEIKAQDFWQRDNQGCRAIRSGNLSKTHKLSYLERVGIMLNADGCKYSIKNNGDIVWKVDFSKKRKINRCFYLLKKAGIEYKVSAPRKFSNSRWKDSIKIVFTLDSTDYKKSFQEWLPYNCGESFVKELLYWDGSRLSKMREFDSKDISSVEFVEQVCVHSGINCSPIRTLARKNKSHSTIYRLDMYWKHGFAFGRNDTALEESIGKAYCFETSTGMFFIRKNGVVLVTGNCQDIDSFKVRKSLIPMGVAVNATVVATGTPDIYIGYFYDTIEQNKAHDMKATSSKQMHFEADYTVAQKYNPYYKKYIQKEIKKIGLDSDEFRLSYRLIWPITKGMVFTKAQLEEKCYDRTLKCVKTWKETPCIAGLDLGKAQDSTWLTVIRPMWDEADEEGNMPKHILNWLEIEGDNWEDQYPQVVDFLSNYWIDTLVCDSTGVGDPIRERYAVLLPNINVAPFVFSPSSKNIGYKYLMQEVNNKRCIIPAHASVRKTIKFKKFEHQMTTLKRHYSGNLLNPCPVDRDKGHDDACLSEDTEILTDRGFIGIDDIDKNDRIINYNLNGTINYSIPKRIIKRDYFGDMVSIEGHNVSQLLTKDHKVVFESLTKLGGKNVYVQRIDKADYLLTRNINTTIRLPKLGKQIIEEYAIDDDALALAGWMIAEGWITQSKRRGWNDSRYQLGQSSIKNPSNIKIIDGIITRLGLSHNRYTRKDGSVIWQFRKETKSFFDDLLCDGTHRIPRNLLSFCSYRQLHIIYDSMMLGDGHIDKNGSSMYYTSSEKLKNDFVELLIRMGKQYSVTHNESSSNILGRKCKTKGIYTIYIKDRFKNKGYLTSASLVHNYSGRVWCVEVDSGFIVIRRNGKVSITGNCDSLMLAYFGCYFENMPEIEETYNDFFRSTRNNAEQIFGRNYSRPRR